MSGYSIPRYEELREMLRKTGPLPAALCFRRPVGLSDDQTNNNNNNNNPRKGLVPIDENIIPSHPPPKKHPSGRNIRPMTLDKCNLYNHQVHTSAGFDVSEPHGAYIISQIAPLNLSYQQNMKECEKLTRIAISTFNSRLMDIEGELEFVKVVKANYQLIRSSYFYLTFEAVNLGNQKTNTYQAMVESLYDHSGFQVLCCRLKPDSDTNEGKWFWDDRERGRADTKGV